MYDSFVSYNRLKKKTHTNTESDNMRMRIIIAKYIPLNRQYKKFYYILTKTSHILFLINIYLNFEVGSPGLVFSIR